MSSFARISPVWALGLTCVFFFACSPPPAAPVYKKTKVVPDSEDANGIDDNSGDVEETNEDEGDSGTTPDDDTPDDKPVVETPDPSSGDPIDPKPTIPVPEVPKPVDPLTLPSYVQAMEDKERVTISVNDAADPLVSQIKGTPEGALRKFSFRSQDSKIYKGDDAWLKNKGSITWEGWLYTPPAYVDGTEIPFMLVGDGGWDQHLKTIPNALNNLIKDKKVPAMAVVFIQPGGGDGPGSQRSLEYDTVSDRFSNFIESEILPSIEGQHKVKFTKDPNGRGTIGGSSSGAMAFTAAWMTPDRYRRVISYSGTFVDRAISAGDQKIPPEDDGAWAYHSGMNLVGNSPRKPLRVWMHVSQNDNKFGDDVKNDWMQANADMAKVLWEKGYPRRFVYANGAGHIDGKVYRSTIPKALIWVWQGYSAPKK